MYINTVHYSHMNKYINLSYYSEGNRIKFQVQLHCIYTYLYCALYYLLMALYCIIIIMTYINQAQELQLSLLDDYRNYNFL